MLLLSANGDTQKATKGLHEPNDGVHAFPVVPYGVNVTRFLLSLGNRQSLNERIELLMCYFSTWQQDYEKKT